MAFPPNYNQERNNRARLKLKAALTKRQKREDKAAERRLDRLSDTDPQSAMKTPDPHEE